MFAYVKYIDDGCKEIVPSSNIKDFDSNLYDIKKIYWVRWQEEFFKAQILLLKGKLYSSCISLNTPTLNSSLNEIANLYSCI